MKIRRVVTGHSPNGISVIASDVEVKPITLTSLPGAEQHNLYTADAPPTFPDDGTLPPFTTYFPPVGGIRIYMLTFLPDSMPLPENYDHQAFLREVEDKLPGLLDCMEPGESGMHTTDTIDFAYILAGEIWLELDDGVEVHLKVGDTVVQNGTRHAWHNRSGETCRALAVTRGAHRKIL